MSKRANGEGTVRQREGGRWEARLVYTDPNTVQTKRASFYGSKASEARAKMRAAGSRLESGAPVRDAKRTVADWLGHWQRTTLAASSRKDTTKVLYRHLISGHVAPAPFGAIPLDRLKPSDVDGLVLSMRSKTKAAPGGITVRALSDATVQRCSPFSGWRSTAPSAMDCWHGTLPLLSGSQPCRDARHGFCLRSTWWHCYGRRRAPATGRLCY